MGAYAVWLRKGKGDAIFFVVVVVFLNGPRLWKGEGMMMKTLFLLSQKGLVFVDRESV